MQQKNQQLQENYQALRDKYQHKKVECKTLKAKLNSFGERILQLEKNAEQELQANQKVRVFQKKKEAKMQTIDDIKGMINQFRCYTTN